MRFTPRELEFIALRFGKAMHYKEIMQELGITLRTCNFHMENVLRKLGMEYQWHSGPTSAIKATHKFIELGIIQIPQRSTNGTLSQS